MVQILSGKKVAGSLAVKIKEQVKHLQAENINPTLAILRIGENSSDIAYERNAMKKANDFDIKVKQYVFDENVTQNDIINTINEINNNKEIHGVLMFRPLPKHLDEDKIRNVLSPNKDIDSITDTSLLSVFTDSDVGYPPCTAEAVMQILKFYDIPIEGKKAVVVGRSLVIGKPVSMLLLKENATVTISHSRTPSDELKKICKEADIIVSAVGRINTITEEYVTDKQIVIDVGINFDENGKMCGDVDFESVSGKVKAITPVPGGVGAVTTTLLMKHVVEAAKACE